MLYSVALLPILNGISACHSPQLSLLFHSLSLLSTTLIISAYPLPPFPAWRTRDNRDVATSATARHSRASPWTTHRLLLSCRYAAYSVACAGPTLPSTHRYILPYPVSLYLPLPLFSFSYCPTTSPFFCVLYSLAIPYPSRAILFLVALQQYGTYSIATYILCSACYNIFSPYVGDVTLTAFDVCSAWFLITDIAWYLNDDDVVARRWT